MRGTAIAGGLFALALIAVLSTVEIHVVDAAAPSSDVRHRQALASVARETGAAGFSEPVLVPLAMPIVGFPKASLADSWGDPRDNGQRPHNGTDIMAPAGTPVVAAAPGTVEKLFQSNAGGTTVYVRSPDRRWSYYYAHLAGYAATLREGQFLRIGDPIGYVGDTGNAGTGNYHLHFGLTRMQPGDRWWQGKPVDPYPSLAGRGGPG